MKINITNKEYRTLVEALELAGWVLHAHAEEEREDTKQFRELEQKILSFAKDFGMKNEISYDSKLEEYIPSRQFEENFLKYIDEYNDDTFWEELIERLVKRDLLREEGKEGFENLAFDERFQKEDPIRIKYENEFEHHGIERVFVRF